MFLLDPIFWIKTTQLILALAILIVLHEGGHFLAAKMFGIRVEKFFLFFDYKWHLISTKDAWVQRLFPRVKNWETEYGIGWIPLGGYVKIAGMLDESMDKEQLKQPVQPWEFRSKRPWQRLIVMLGGVIVNMITAMVVYACISWSNGIDTIPMDRNFADGFYYNKSAQAMGFEQGDKITRIDTARVTHYNPTNIMFDLAEAATVTVQRVDTDEEITFDLPEDFQLIPLLKEFPPFFAPLVPAVIDSVISDSPAAKAGLVKGTSIKAMDDASGVLTDLSSWNRFDEIMSQRQDVLAAEGCTRDDSLRMRTIVVQFLLPGDSIWSTAEVELDNNYMFGFIKEMPQLDYDHTDFTLLEAIPEGCKLGWSTLVSYIGQFKYIFGSMEGAKSVGSFYAIGSMFDDTWNWLRFWNITAFLSIMLAFINVMPIPGLDGGHAFFTLIEMVTGHTFSEKFQERALNIGFTLILLLMIWALSMDFLRIIS